VGKQQQKQQKQNDAQQVLLDIVDHGHDVVVLRHLLVTGRHDGEAQEHEDAHQRRAVGSVALEADEHLVALELLLGELEQRDEAVARALGQHRRGDVHEQDVVEEESTPFHLLVGAQRALEVEEQGVGVVCDLVEVRELCLLLAVAAGIQLIRVGARAAGRAGVG